MYDELVKRLQDFAAETMRDDDAEIAFDALEAIAKLEHKVFILEGDREGLIAQIPRWIPVTERLPEENGYYLTYVESSIFPNSYYLNMIKFIDGNFVEDHCVIYRVTHWMPLPDPPKEEP